MATQPTKGGNPQAIQAGIDQRNHIVELVAADVDNGGDGMTRGELAAELGISKPSLHRHLTELFKDRRIEQIGMKVMPSKTGHIHICRTCGKTIH
jgi:predicted ArsR family transcriptional regulator